MKASVTEIPFNSFLGVQIATDPSKLLGLPSGDQYLNHLGTVHASAQLALAEASTGEFLLRHFGSIEGIVPVVRRLEAKFRKPANGAPVRSTERSGLLSLGHWTYRNDSNIPQTYSDKLSTLNLQALCVDSSGLIDIPRS